MLRYGRFCEEGFFHFVLSKTVSSRETTCFCRNSYAKYDDTTSLLINELMFGEMGGFTRMQSRVVQSAKNAVSFHNCYLSAAAKLFFVK